MIGIVDYKTGNLRSVENALARLQAPCKMVCDPDDLAGCDGVLLPGVGEARWAMEQLMLSGLDKVIPVLDCPVLGICLGMQVLCSHSQEGDTACLGVFSQEVRRMYPAEGIKIPHMGWNTLETVNGPLFEGLTEGVYMYFVHSYAVDPGPCTVAVTRHGSPLSAALQYRNFFGCQFHPEKSGLAGERVLSNFLNLCQ